MGDLVRRLRDPRGNSPTSMDGYEDDAVGFRDKMCAEAADRIEQLERKLVLAKEKLDLFWSHLTAEKALADRLHFALTNHENADINAVFSDYRKARGL